MNSPQQDIVNLYDMAIVLDTDKLHGDSQVEAVVGIAEKVQEWVEKPVSREPELGGLATDIIAAYDSDDVDAFYDVLRDTQIYIQVKYRGLLM